MLTQGQEAVLQKKDCFEPFHDFRNDEAYYVTITVYMGYQEKYTEIDLQGIMQRRITRILLVCSAYDRFTLEEDGRIEEQLARDYGELGLTNPPRLTHVESGDEALAALCESPGGYDLVISMFALGEMDVFTLSHRIKALRADLPFVLLSSYSREVARRFAEADTSSIDYAFSWQGNAELILAIIKMFEDQLNAPYDVTMAGVQAILLVEDNVRFYSIYLPELYRIVIEQCNEFSREALNQKQRSLRKRARPKIFFARDYREAEELYSTYKENLLGVISDVSFRRSMGDPEVDWRAGITLCRRILDEMPTCPVVLQSTNTGFAADAAAMGVDFIDKNAHNLTGQISDFIDRRMAFGEFSFASPATGEVIATVHDLGDMQRAVETLPIGILAHYTARNMLSKWLYARGLFSLAQSVRAVKNSEFADLEDMRTFLLRAIREYRRQMGQGVVAEFDPQTYNSFISFARSGSGSLGGKARGLAFIGEMLERHELYNRWPGVRVTIPRTLVLATDHFDEFIESNFLHHIGSAEIALSDEEILAKFMRSPLPARTQGDLRVFLDNVKRPLAVRSSSKLEDSHFQPFAGIYATYMVPRVPDPAAMLDLLGRAIKSVYASVYYAGSRAYIEASSNALADEKMGIVIQEICGTEDSGLYFPTFSGVARSLNAYPIGDERPDEGIANIAWGLGKLVVEGGATLRFSPRHPHHILQLSSPEFALRDTQRQMYALNLDPARFTVSTDEAVNLDLLEVNRVTHLRSLKHVASTWDAANRMLSDSSFEQGRKVVTFSRILRYDAFPLADILSVLLTIGVAELRSPIEIEFAVNMDVEPGTDKIFNFLQIRPVATASQSGRIDWATEKPGEAILYSESALGLGAVEGLQDIIYVRPGTFRPAESEAMAHEIDALNRAAHDQGWNYILVGHGRWGSADPWLGVPVRWQQISEARVIAECGLDEFRVDPSQGTHFFQNLTSFGVGYLTVNPFLPGGGTFDVAALEGMPAVAETAHFRHVRFPSPLFVFVDGLSGRAIVRLAHA